MSGKKAKAARKAAGYVKPRKTPSRPYHERGTMYGIGLMGLGEYIAREYLNRPRA